MKKIIWLILALIIILSACQPHAISVTILDGEQVISLSTTKTVPADLLAEANLILGANDRIIYLGAPTPPDIALSEEKSIILTVRRAVTLTLDTPDGQKSIQTSALTVGEALTEAGYKLHAADRLAPPAEMPITGPLEVIYRPAQDIVISVDGTKKRGLSAAATVGKALAEAGIPLVGLDYSRPAESAPLPDDGQIRVIRVVESVALTQKTIPFSTRNELSADLEIDHQELLQGGEPGLAMARLRTRTEDGVQVSQQSESESIVRPPQDRIMGFGMKIVIRTTTVDGVTIEYWRALNLKATSYSPCRSATPDGRCSYGTSSGQTVHKGVVAMVYSWYLLFGFEHIYVPGYGTAMVGDVGGGWPLGNHYWVDLGWSEEEYQPLTYFGGVTVYFLTPVPANPGYILP